MNKVLKNNAIMIAFLAITIAYFFAWFSEFGGENIHSDGRWYYEYFIRLFINHNLDGSGIIKYPVGTMILQLPFLIIAMGVSIVSGADFEGGLSLHFQRAVFCSALFYYVMAVTMLYRLTKKRYTEKSSVLMILCLTFGTMIPVYICEMSSFSHIYGFFICTSFFCFVDFYEQKRNKQNAVIFDLLLGALLGYAAIIRNTNIVIGAVYLFYNVDSFRSFAQRIKSKIIKPRIVLQIVGCMLVYGIQMIFWKRMTGEWILYSYMGEEFVYLRNPQILNVWFSDGKGLFIYCPVLLIAIISMLFFRKENTKYRIAQWVIFAAITYFTAAWWCWWLGAAYGERMYCDVLCIFAVPLASFFYNLNEWTYKPKSAKGYSEIIHRYVPIVCYTVVIFFVVLNLVWINGVRSGNISNNFGTWYDLRNQFYNYFIR